MNTKRFILRSVVFAVFTVVVTVGYIVCVRHSRLLRRSLQIGDMDWIYMGNNRSEIQFNGRTIVGLCQLEIMEESDFIYGNSDEDSPWFVIDKNTHQVVRGQGLNDICREMGVSYPIERFRFETFLTRWNRVEQ